MTDQHDYVTQYVAAKMRTDEAAKRGLVHEAAALAQQIRWNPEKRLEYKYPNGMDMATTCCCHICVDDPNFDNSSVAFCAEQAREHGHADCARLAGLLGRASKTQRYKINHLAWFGDYALPVAHRND
jgi:hypothetical protein